MRSSVLRSDGAPREPPSPSSVAPLWKSLKASSREIPARRWTDDCEAPSPG